MPVIASTIEQVREYVTNARNDGQTVGFVPTMGALHEGHLTLVREARQATDFVVVSIFVNPLQFGRGEDLDRYPRDLDADVALLGDQADLVFAPSVDEMYPDGDVSTRVVAGPAGDLFEGAARPGHFDGMLTVVSKLLNIVGADRAFFGQKDAQQVFLVQRMVRDLNVPTQIAVVPTVRERDGLALSSRNRYLDESEREAALTLARMLTAAREAGGQGLGSAIEAGRRVAEARPDVDVDYFVAVDPATFAPAPEEASGEVLILVAARVGSTRLIDNAYVSVAHK